jgi:hypothetical protein
MFPFRGQALKEFDRGGLKAPTNPKRRIFLRPQPKDAVMSANGLDAFPEQLPRGIGHGKIRVPFAVEQGVLADDLNANRADDLSVGSFNHLKFGEPFFQFTRREVHGIPKRFQT